MKVDLDRLKNTTPYICKQLSLPAEMPNEEIFLRGVADFFLTIIEDKQMTMLAERGDPHHVVYQLLRDHSQVIENKLVVWGGTLEIINKCARHCESNEKNVIAKISTFFRSSDFRKRLPSHVLIPSFDDFCELLPFEQELITV